MPKINCHTIIVSHTGVNDYPDIEYGPQGIILGRGITFPVTNSILGEFKHNIKEVDGRTKSYLYQLDNEQIQTDLIPDVIEWDEPYCYNDRGELEYFNEPREDDVSSLLLVKTKFKGGENFINISLRCVLPVSYWKERNRIYAENKGLIKTDPDAYKKMLEELKVYYDKSFDYDIQNNGCVVVAPEDKTTGYFSYLIAMANYSKFELIINRGYTNSLPNVFRIENDVGLISIIDTRNYK